MENGSNIWLKMLGGFSIRTEPEGEWVKIDDSGRMKKLWSLVEYLIVHRKRDISTDELIEVFWPDQVSGNPISALRDMVYRARSVFDELNFPQLIVSVNGRYAWNAKITTYLDAEEFEQLYIAAKAEKTEDKLNSLLSAWTLYEGDFLSGATSDWSDSIRIYYRSVYIDLCIELIKGLWQVGQYNDVIRICERAYTFEPGIEEFSLYFMRALILLGQPQTAIEHYAKVKKMLWEQYGFSPSDDLDRANTEAEFSLAGAEVDTKDIFALLKEEKDRSSAFLCAFSVFRSIVWLEARAVARTKENAQLVTIRIIEKKTSAGPSTDMKRLERVLLSSLRAGDPLTRLSATQYIILLPNATKENADTVMLRVETNFAKAYPRSKARIRYTVFPIQKLNE